MPIELANAVDETNHSAAEKNEADSLETHSPHALTPRAKAFCEQALALTEQNTRTLSEDDFDDLCESYDHLEGFERYAASIELQRAGITWTYSLENDKDGYDDELNGYRVYCEIRSASTTSNGG